MTRARVRLAMASMGKPDTKVGELCKVLGVSRQSIHAKYGKRGNRW